VKIAVFTDSYHPYVSGVVRSIDTFAAQLLALGHEVYIFGPRYYYSEKFHASGSGSDGDGPATRVFRYWSIPVPMYRGFAAPVPISVHAEQVIRELEIDVLHSHTPFAMGTLCAVLARRLRRPFVFTHHTMYHEYVHYVPGVRTALRELMLRYVGAYCRRTDLVIAPTPQVRDFIVEAYGLDTRRVKAIPTGIEPDEFRHGDGAGVRRRLGIPADAAVLTFVGRLGREKNVEFLLRAFKLVAARRSDAHLVLVGDGPIRSQLEELAAQEGLAGRVHFTGTLAKPDVIDVYHAADVFVIASTTETQGLVTLEAMAAGLPVVGVDAPGTHDLVEHGVQGLLTPEAEDAFAEAIVRMLGDAQLRARFSRQALERAERFSARHMALKLLEAYEELVRARAGVAGGRNRLAAME